MNELSPTSPPLIRITKEGARRIRRSNFRRRGTPYDKRPFVQGTLPSFYVVVPWSPGPRTSNPFATPGATA